MPCRVAAARVRPGIVWVALMDRTYPSARGRAQGSCHTGRRVARATATRARTAAAVTNASRPVRAGFAAERLRRNPVRLRAMSTDQAVLDTLVERVRVDRLAWINGDSSGYEFEDETSTILGAFGGRGHRHDRGDPGQRRAVAQFESGTGRVELINGGVSGDLAWLVVIEHAKVKFVDHDAPVRWDLRVTEVFERRRGAWVRVHRHADPMVDRHPLDEVLALLP